MRRMPSNWRVIEGGGEGTPALDLSRFLTRRLLRSEEDATGILARHFDVFEAVAKAREFIILVRKGKKTCLPWINQDYPAKPPEISTKNDPSTGKVTCKAAAQYKEAYDAGYFVLKQDSESAQSLTAYHPTKGTLPNAYPKGTNEQNQVGQVIDPESGLALTGDYDLMAVINVYSPLGARALTLIHDQRYANNAMYRETRKMAFKVKDGLLYLRSNPIAESIVRDLNEGFGGRPRIMHGPHDLKFSPDYYNNDGCAVFTPDGAFLLDTLEDLIRFYRQIGRFDSESNVNNLPHLKRDNKFI